MRSEESGLRALASRVQTLEAASSAQKTSQDLRSFYKTIMGGQEIDSPQPNDEPLYTSGVYEYHNRPRRDAGWGIAYAVFLAVTAISGIYAATHVYVLVLYDEIILAHLHYLFTIIFPRRGFLRRCMAILCDRSIPRRVFCWFYLLFHTKILLIVRVFGVFELLHRIFLLTFLLDYAIFLSPLYAVMRSLHPSKRLVEYHNCCNAKNLNILSSMHGV